MQELLSLLGPSFRGNLTTHLIGILGGAVWCIGLSASVLASEKARLCHFVWPELGATIVAVIWGYSVGRNSKNAPAGTNILLGLMLFFYLNGLAGIIAIKALILPCMLRISINCLLNKFAPQGN